MSAMTSLFGAGGQAKDVQPVLLASLRGSQKMLKSNKGEGLHSRSVPLNTLLI